MKYKVTLNGRTYEIEVEAGKAMCLDEYEAIVPTAAPVAAPAPVAAAPAAAPAPTALSANTWAAFPVLFWIVLTCRWKWMPSPYPKFRPTPRQKAAPMCESVWKQPENAS